MRGKQDLQHGTPHNGKSLGGAVTRYSCFPDPSLPYHALLLTC